MRTPTEEFDVPALSAALHEQRRARGLTWAQAAREMSAAFAGTRASPISPSTLTGLPARGAIDADGVLQMLLWLGRSPESFVPGRREEPRDDERLPRVGPDRILRLDTTALHRALDGRRAESGMTWTGVAREIGGLQAAALTRLAKGGRIGIRDAMRILAWLGRPAAGFTRAAEW